VALGVGQGGLVLLAFLPEAEREAVIHYNVPRLRDLGYFDEVFLRSEIDRARELGYVANRQPGLIPGMAGVAVPVLDRRGLPVAALSVGTLAERLMEDRLPQVVMLLTREASAIGQHVNPFDVTLRYPGIALGGPPTERAHQWPEGGVGARRRASRPPTDSADSE
jgi:DNA-binding IclR family transcriptional regulator